MIENSKTFLYNFFFDDDYSPADRIDRKVTKFVVQFCLDQKMIESVERNGLRMYHILAEGKKIIGR